MIVTGGSSSHACVVGDSCVLCVATLGVMCCRQIAFARWRLTMLMALINLFAISTYSSVLNSSLTCHSLAGNIKQNLRILLLGSLKAPFRRLDKLHGLCLLVFTAWILIFMGRVLLQGQLVRSIFAITDMLRVRMLVWWDLYALPTTELVLDKCTTLFARQFFVHQLFNRANFWGYASV